MRIFAIAFLACLGHGAASAQVGVWTELENSPHPSSYNRFEDLHFVSPDTGWVVGLDSDIFKTTDGGESWEHQVSGEIPGIGPRQFRSVGFVDASRGYVGTLNHGSVLFETLDGGTTWQDVTSRIEGPVPEGICGISVVDQNHVFAAGRYNGPAIFLKTVDGGATWQSTDLSAYASRLIDTIFFNENDGLVVGGLRDATSNRMHAVVLSTADGGLTWQNRYTGNAEQSEWGWKLSFPTRATGYVSIEFAPDLSFPPATVLRTADGGLSWQPMSVPLVTQYRGLQGVGFVTDSVGWVGGRGTNAATNSSGNSWSEFDSIDGAVNRFRFFGDTLGYAVGGSVYKYNRISDTGTASSTSADPPIVEAVFPQPTSGMVTVRIRGGLASTPLVRIYDVTGRLLADQTSGAVSIGADDVSWDTRHASQVKVGPGVYFMRLNIGGQIVSSPIVVVSQ